MRARIESELELLRAVFSTVEHVEQDGEDWFRIPSYAIRGGWLLDGQPAGKVPVTFLIKADYPGAAPYGFLTPAGLSFNGHVPQNVSGPPKPVPFRGSWLHFSWQAENWRPTADARTGSNLVAWCRSFAVRLAQGA